MTMIPKKIKGIVRPSEMNKKSRKYPAEVIGKGNPNGKKGQFIGTSKSTGGIPR